MEWGEGGNWWVKGAVKKGARDDKRVWGSILGNIHFSSFCQTSRSPRHVHVSVRD